MVGADPIGKCQPSAVSNWSVAHQISRGGPQSAARLDSPTRQPQQKTEGDTPMAKKSRKKKARKNSKANHGKRPNS
jgi:hypothetical protein